MTNHEKHIATWNRLAETGRWDKWNIVDELFPDRPLNDCYACKSVKRKDEDYANCGKCPVDWGSKDNHCCSEDSPYSLWLNETDPKARKLLAAQIRDLPWRTK